MSSLEKIKQLLYIREPIFHNRALTYNRETIDNEMHSDFWEISASGELYTRDFVLDYLENRYDKSKVDESVLEKWQKKDFRIQHLGDDVYMVTYILDGQNRLTRRTTLWKGTIDDGFKILYHQGTVVLNV